MSKQLHPIIADMAHRLNTFRSGSFGVGRRDDSSPLALFTDRQILPVSSIRIALWEQDGTPLMDSRTLPDGYRLILDDAGRFPAACRLALIQKESQSVIALTDDTNPINGFVFITVQTSAPDSPTFAVSAVFGNNQGHQMSTILWSDEPELIQFLKLHMALLERGDVSDVRQFQPESLSARLDAFS